MAKGAGALYHYVMERQGDFRHPPNFIELEVVETDPGLKGDTAQGGSKPATLSSGAVVRVPLFINQGEVLKIDTRSGEYVSRA